MRELPKGGLIGKTVSFADYISSLRIGIHAANASFFIILAVFPTLVLLLGLLRYTGLDADYLVKLLDGVVPAALLPGVKRLILSTYQNSTGALVSISAVIALWSASCGVHGIHKGLNAIYETEESRGFLRTRFFSIAYTVAFLLALVLTLVLNVFGTTIIDHAPVDQNPLLSLLSEFVNFRFLVMLVLLTAVFASMYMVLPNKHHKLKESLPGALMATVGWLICADLFSLYVVHFPSYANLFGSVYAVALVMFWLYFCISIVFYGAVLNQLLARRRERKAAEKNLEAMQTETKE